MAENKNKVVLVEIGGSHDECLLTQMIALTKNGKEVILIATPEVIERNPGFPNYVSRMIEVVKHKSKRKVAAEVWAHIKKLDPQLVVFNTAQGGTVRNICLKARFSKIEFAGIIHTTRKFQGSFTQKVINSKIKKYLLLSEYLHATIEAPKGIKTSWFYPIDFYHTDKKIHKTAQVQVAIIGGVEKRRKDLTGFMEILKNLKRTNVQFVFLGKTESYAEEVIELRELVINRKLDDQVRLFNYFLPQEDFDAELKITDIILPLVHPDTPSADEYFRNQISGAMSVSFGYNIPMMIHKAYEHIEEMKEASIYYDLDNFYEQLEAAILYREAKSEHIKNAYKPEDQQDRYFSFLFPN